MFPITYLDSCATEIGEVTGLKCVDQLRTFLHMENMGLEKVSPGEMNIEQALDVLENVPCDMEDTRKARMFFLTSVGNSAEEHEFVSALQRNNKCPSPENMTIMSMVVLPNQKTLDSVGEPWNAKQNPKYAAISYDPYKPPEKWKELSEQIFNDLCKATNGKEYDIMFHTGCTSKDWQKTAAGGHANSWKLVEHWSMMLTIASMRHALMHLAPGGQLYLKIRHFEKPETHGIITLLAQCFEKHKVYG